MILEEDKRHYVLIKDLNTFIYDHISHRGRKHVYCYCFQAFSTAEILKSHVNDCFKINAKQMIMMHKKGEYVKFKNYERKKESPLMIYADFERVLVPEDNGKQNESYKNKYEKHVAFSYCYKLACLDLVNFLIHTYIKKLFTILLIV